MHTKARIFCCETKMAMLVGCVIVLIGALYSDASRIHHDPELLKRIPENVRRNIDELVNQHFERAVATHFQEPGSLTLPFQDVNRVPIEKLHRRLRRDVTNATSNGTGVFSAWSDFGKCSVKCGGGQQVRYRTCSGGDCRSLGAFTEVRKCGILPCVAGSYILDSVDAFDLLPIPGAKFVKFFSIQGMRYFGYITDTKLLIQKWSSKSNSFVQHQTIPVTSGISFDILNTYPRTYIAVLQKAVMVFPGRFSKMYYYDPWSTYFQMSSAVTIDVWEPSAMKAFDVFGTAFLGIVNYQTRVVSNFGFTLKLLICTGETRTMACQPGSIINVVNAMYGRVSNYECASGVDVFMSWFSYYATCVVPGAKAKVSAVCDGKQYCQLTANAVNYVTAGATSCPHTKNYLRVVYTCNTISFMGRPIFYKWDGVGLSLVSGAKLITYGAKDIEAFSIHDIQYIAVANHNDQKTHHLDSEIYMYNLDSGRFESLQRIRTDGAVDFEFFGVGEGLAREYFLAVANHVKVLPSGIRQYALESVIYKWNWNLFVPFQCLKTYGAKKWTALTGAKGRFTLAINNLYGDTTFYSYDGWRFNVATVQPKEKIFEKAIALYVHKQSDEPMFLVQNTNAIYDNTRNHYKTRFMQTFPKFELLEATLHAVEKLNRSVYEDLIPKAEIFNTSYNAVKEDIVFLENITFTAHKTFSKIRVVGNTTVEYANITNINLSPSDLKTVNKLKVLNQTITDIAGQVDAANRTLANVVTKSSEQVITSRKNFPGLNVSTLTVKWNLDVGGTINGVDISGLKETALYLNENATVSAGFLFQNASFSNVIVSGTFGNIRTEDVVSIDQEETIFGEKRFDNVKFEGLGKSNINVYKLLNGINTSDFVTVHGDQHINANYFFNNTAVVLGNVSVAGMVNNEDLLAIVEDTVMTDGLDVVAINASKRFQKVNILEDLNMKDNTTINGIDVSQLSTIGLHMISDSFNSTVTFASNITFLGNVTLGGSVNGLNLSDVVFTNVDSVIVGAKVISGNMNTTAGIKVDGKINGVNLSNILDTVNNQTISGRKSFISDVYIISDITTSGLVDGVNVSDAYLRSLLMNTMQNITGYKSFSNLTVNTLELQSCSHDCRLLDALSNIKYQCAKESNPVINITGSKHFRNLKIEGSSQVSGLVNNVDIPGDLLVQGKNQSISGRNVFISNVVVGNVDMARINNVNVSSMYKKALPKSNITINGRKVFKDNVVVNGDTTVAGKINGINFGDVVKTFKDETVRGRKRFMNSVSVGELSAKTMETFGLIDGVNLTSLEKELLNLLSEKIVKGTKIFKRGVSFAGNWSIPGLIDGVNLTELYNSAMTLDGDQRISSLKIFERLVSVTGELSVRGLVDNVNLTDLASRAVLAFTGNANQTIEGNVTFRTVTLRDNMVVSGLINGHNLTEFVNDTLMKTGDQVINGKHSINDLSVVGNVSVAGTVNGFNLSVDVVFLQTTNVISSQKNFTNTLKVESLNTKEINGLNFTRFAKRVAYINQDTVINGFITFKSNLNVEKNLIVRELINKINLRNVIQTTILKAGDQDIKQPVHFEDVIFEDDILNTHHLNSRNFTSFTNNIIYKCSGPNKNITGTLNFNAMSVKGVLRLINLIVNGKINAIDLNLLNEQTVKDSGDYIIRGYKQVKGELVVRNITTGSINNFRFPNDFVSISGEAAITAKKTFLNDVVVTGDMNITSRRTVNTVDLSETSKKMVRLDGNHTLSSAVEFRGDVTIKGNMDARLINGINVSREELLLQVGNQTVTASKIFSDVRTDGGISSGNYVNGFNLAKMENESFVSGRKNVVQGMVTVLGDVVVKGNVYSPKVDSVDVSNITSHFEGFNSISNYVDTRIPLSNISLGRTRAIINQLSASIKDVHQSIDYFVDNEEVMLPYISTSIDVRTSGGEVWLAAGALSDVRGNPCINTSVFVRSHSNDAQPKTFVDTHSVLSNAVSDVKFVNGKDRIFMVSSSNRESGTCLSNIPVTEQRSVAYVYDAYSKQFKKYASTRTNGARGVSVDVFGNEVFALFTNTYFNLSPCVKQSLHSLSSSVFSLIGSFTSCNVIKSIILMQDNTKATIAVLGTSYVGYRQLDIIDVFRNGSTSVKQTIATHFASDVTQISSGDMKSIVIANTYDSSEEALAFSYNVPVTVYRLNSWGLYVPYQDIAVTSALKVHPLRIGIYDYLAIATLQQKIIIFKHKGASKWNIELTVPIQGHASIKDIKTWSFRNEVYMAVLSSDTWNARYPSKIRVMRGYLTSTVEGSDIIRKVAAEV